jgi:DNA-binding response OmpR family regulator
MLKRPELDADANDSPAPDEVLVIAGSRQRSRDLVAAVTRLGWQARSLRSIHASAHRCAVVVLDCVGDIENARQTCYKLRRVIGHGRLLAITHECHSMGRAMLLESGADLVLSEPFVRRELVACVQALTRRARGDDDPTASIPRTSDALHEPARCEPLVQGVPLREVAKALQLTETERLLLAMLLTAPTPVATTRLSEAVFPDVHYAADSSHLRVHMHRLRTKLVRLGLTVQGLHGRGYRLIDIRRDDALANASPYGGKSIDSAEG